MTLHFMKRRLVWATLPLVLAAVAAPAGEDADEFYVNTLRSVGRVAPTGARSSAMGGSGRGLADGVASLGVNPAAMGAVRGSGFDASLGYDWLDDGRDDTGQTTFKVGGAVSLDRWRHDAGPNQAIGGLLHTMRYSGAGVNGMKRDQTGVLAAYGIHLLDDLLAGVSVAVYNGKWDSMAGLVDAGGNAVPDLDRKFIGGDFRVGGLYRLSGQTTLGGTVEYSTGSWKERGVYAGDAGSGDLSRYGLGVGVAHQYCDETLILGDIWFDRMKADVPGVIKEDVKSWGLSTGVEQEVIPEMMALRGGLYYDRVSYSGRGSARMVSGNSFSKGRFGITAGVGLRLYGWDFGYALDVNSGGDVRNTLDVSAEW